MILKEIYPEIYLFFLCSLWSSINSQRLRVFIHSCLFNVWVWAHLMKVNLGKCCVCTQLIKFFSLIDFQIYWPWAFLLKVMCVSCCGMKIISFQPRARLSVHMCSFAVLVNYKKNVPFKDWQTLHFMKFMKINHFVKIGIFEVTIGIKVNKDEYVEYFKTPLQN